MVAFGRPLGDFACCQEGGAFDVAAFVATTRRIFDHSAALGGMDLGTARGEKGGPWDGFVEACNYTLDKGTFYFFY